MSKATGFKSTLSVKLN
jgi:hypothetical protein